METLDACGQTSTVVEQAKPIRRRLRAQVAPGRSAQHQRCEGCGRLPIGPRPRDAGRAAFLETPRTVGHGRRAPPKRLPVGAAPALGAAQSTMDAREMAPQAWATEMQLATKTMLRSGNKQRLGRVKRPRKLKDALALEASP